LVACRSAAESVVHGISVKMAAMAASEVSRVKLTVKLFEKDVCRSVMAAHAVLAAWVAKKRVREACTRGERVVVCIHPHRPLAGRPHTVS
jgi:hypothetical protein